MAHTLASSTAIGVGFDTARYGHHVTFLRGDLNHACPAFEFPESQAGYQRVLKAFTSLHQSLPAVHFHIRLDAAGQYAANLEAFLRKLPFAKTITVGEPARNLHYRKALFPKRKADPVESLCAARFALLEQPKATVAVPDEITQLREIVARLEGQTRHSTRLVNQLHNLLARVFPELAVLVADLQAGWILQLLDSYPTPALLASVPIGDFDIPHFDHAKAEKLQAAARNSVASTTGDTAATLVQLLVAQLRASLASESRLKKLMTAVYQKLPNANHLDSIPGIGAATAAVLTAKMVSIERFATAAHVVGFFATFAEEDTSGLDKEGRPKPGRQHGMSRKGNDLVRKYLWNAAKTATIHNPAVKALYCRHRARGVRGDVALGHGMRKLLQLAFAVWKTGRPFDSQHFPWGSGKTPDNKKAAGHIQESCPGSQVVTAVDNSIKPELPERNTVLSPATPLGAAGTTVPAEGIDFAALRAQVRMEDVLAHLDCFDRLKGSGPQRRGPCPLHGADDGVRVRTFSVHLGRKVFQCFHPPCGAKGNVLDLWAAAHQLPLYEAAIHLAQTFRLTLYPPYTPEKRNP